MTGQFSMPNAPTTALPMTEPSTLETPTTAAASPKAMPRFSTGNVVPISALATGIIPPAPTACTTRPTSKTAKLPMTCDRPQMTAPRQNTPMHTVNTRGRPRLSAILPITGMSAA